MSSPELHDAHVQRWALIQIVSLWVRTYGVAGARRLYEGMVRR